MIQLPDIEKIYFPKTREYFKEVMTSYSIGNYRSANVMLYAIAISDILYKLQELKDMYNDTVAEKILEDINKKREDKTLQSKSAWEKELVDRVYKDTELLNLESYTNLNHLYDNRNFSAHPALNENYDLISPSQETTISNIKNVLNDILIKPPIFIKKVVEMLTEDLKGKESLYENEDAILDNYLNSKYYSRMSISMKQKTLEAFWKFCCKMPEDEDCKANGVINRKALQVLLDSFEIDAVEYIKTHSNKFTVEEDENCLTNLVCILAFVPTIYPVLSEKTKLQIDKFIERNNMAKAFAWFKYENVDKHLTYLRKQPGINFDNMIINRLYSHYALMGEKEKILEFFVWYYFESCNFACADSRFNQVVRPFLGEMSIQNFKTLLHFSNKNSQLYNRGQAYYANTTIIKVARNVLGNDYDYSQYRNLSFDKTILTDEKVNEGN